MISDTVGLTGIFAKLGVFRASARVATKCGQISSQGAENRCVRERLKSLPR